MGDGDIDDLSPTLSCVLAAPKLSFVVAHRQQGPVDSDREVRLADAASVLGENDLSVEDGLAQKESSGPSAGFPAAVSSSCSDDSAWSRCREMPRREDNSSNGCFCVGAELNSLSSLSYSSRCRLSTHRPATFSTRKASGTADENHFADLLSGSRLSRNKYETRSFLIPCSLQRNAFRCSGSA